MPLYRCVLSLISIFHHHEQKYNEDLCASNLVCSHDHFPQIMCLLICGLWKFPRKAQIFVWQSRREGLGSEFCVCWTQKSVFIIDGWCWPAESCCVVRTATDFPLGLGWQVWCCWCNLIFIPNFNSFPHPFHLFCHRHPMRWIGEKRNICLKNLKHTEVQRG